MSVFSKCIKADLELVSADKSGAIARSDPRACRSAQRCCSALPVFLLSLSHALSTAKAWTSQALLMQRVVLGLSQQHCRSPRCAWCQETHAEFGRGTREDKFVVTEVVILAPFYFMWYVFCLLYHRAWVRHSLPLVQLLKCVWYHITLWS